MFAVKDRFNALTNRDRGNCVVVCCRARQLGVRQSALQRGDERSTYFRDKTYCPLRNKNFTLRKISGEAIQNLAAQLTDSPNGKKEAAKAALIANEIANRAMSKTIKEAYRACAVIQASKFLDVEKPLVYDQSQKQVVTTAQFNDCVRSYQVKEALKPTGNLEYATLTIAAGTTAEQLLSNPSDD